MKSKKVLIIFTVLALVFLSGTFTVYSFVKEINRPKLPELGKTVDFSLINSNNEPFSSDYLKGRVWIADFFFTTCGDICPVMSKNMAALNRTFERVQGIELVSITVNPEFDTPQILDNYAQKQQSNLKNWHFLTGKREEIKRIALEGFKLGSIEEPVFHSSYFSLVDRNGYVRGYYDGTETKAINRLFKDATRLLKER